jgi:hypothetical protein
MPVVFTEYLKTASARSSLSRTARQRALSELNWGTLLPVADVEIVFILQRYHCRLWQKLRFLLSNSANLPRGPLFHDLIVSYLQNEKADIKNVMPSKIPTMPPAIGISSWPFLRGIRQIPHPISESLS